MAPEETSISGEFVPALLDLIRLLQRTESQGVLIGGVAVGLQGYQRTTRDVDILLWGEGVEIPEFLQHAREWGRGIGTSPSDSLSNLRCRVCPPRFFSV